MGYEVNDWIDDFANHDFVWFIKRLSGNDTLANNAHQAGPYIPKKLFFTVFPSLKRPNSVNPDTWFDLFIDSHSDTKRVRAVWYNQSTRNESRITNLGGQASALLDPESTGALTVFAFLKGITGEASECHVWVCRHETEADLIEDLVGPVEPGKWKVWIASGISHLVPEEYEVETIQKPPCYLIPDDIPQAWFDRFPGTLEIIKKTLQLESGKAYNADKRLVKRRLCEYGIFLSLEEAVEMPRILQGFNNISEFVDVAQTILQRRKSRSGRSLELHVREIMIEEGLVEGEDFSYSPESEPGKKPDFLFPSQNAYQDPFFPSNQLRMLAAKTTCKDRWRQILNEAGRIPNKHLLTLQEGVSEKQFKEMTDAGVQLVIPEPIMTHYPISVRPHLKTFESFIADIRLLRVG